MREDTGIGTGTGDMADVVIVGGGPNGLLLAGELGLAGVRPVLLERLGGRSAAAKANGLVGRVVEALDLRGLYGELAGRGGPPAPLPYYQFSGIALELGTLPENPMHTLPVPQARIEEVLEARAARLGTEIRRGHELVALAQDTDAVTVEVRDPDGRTYALRTRWLVGADGGHSTVRKAAGIAFPGDTDDSFSSCAAHVVLPGSLLAPGTGELRLPGGPGTRVPLRPYAHNRLPAGVFTFAEMPPGSGVHVVATFEWDRPPGAPGEPMTFDALRASVRRVLGTDLPMSPPEGPGPHLLRRTDGVNSRQAQTYRAGRVLLLGDAAHVHSAVGGPGLNLGLQDALNLGWKLAAQVRGWAPPGLLDSYEAERAPVSRRVLMHTRAQMALMRPGEGISATRELLAELLDGDPGRAARAHLAALLAGSDVGYGRWYPRVRALIGEGRAGIDAALRSARPVLVRLSDEAPAVEGWGDRLATVTARPAVPSAAHSDSGADAAPLPPAFVVRPDGYLA